MDLEASHGNNDHSSRGRSHGAKVKLKLPTLMKSPDWEWMARLKGSLENIMRNDTSIELS